MRLGHRQAQVNQPASLTERSHSLAWRTLLAAAIVCGLITALCARVLGAVDPTRADVTWEWVFVHAASGGSDLSTGIESLALQTGAVFDDGEPAVRDEEDVAFRTPGALLVLLPLLLVPWQDAFFWMTIVGGLSLLALFAVVIPRSVNRRLNELILPTIAAILSAPVVESLNWGTSSAIAGLLFSLAWCNLDRPASGTFLGVATNLKLYPGLGVIALFASRRARSALWALGVILVMNALGSLVFGWSPLDAAALMIAGSEDYVGLFGNLSLAGLISQAGGPTILAAVITLVALAGTVAFSRRHSARQSVAFAVALALVASPLSWLHYELIALPIALWVYGRRSLWRWAAFISWTWILASTILFAAASVFEALWIVNLIVLVRLLIPVAVALSPRELWNDGVPVRQDGSSFHVASPDWRDAHLSRRHTPFDFLNRGSRELRDESGGVLANPRLSLS